MNNPKVVWGQPAVDINASSFVAQYAPWLMIGALVLLALATSGKGDKA